MKFPRTIYALKHEPTGKIYVGSTNNLWLRTSSHIYSAINGMHPSKELIEDVKNYGPSFSLSILDVIWDYAEKDKEYLWMDALNTRDPQYGYNNQEKAKQTRLVKRKYIPVDISKESAETIKKAERIAFERNWRNR